MSTGNLKPRFTDHASRPRVGLVLGGGATRGVAHLGVLQVFEEEGIRPDLVVGSSAGSVAGGLYCAGWSPFDLQAVARQVKWTRVARPVPPRLGLFDIRRMERVIRELIGDVTFADLRIPFAATAVDLLACELVVLTQGRVARAIRASCSVPGIFNPVEDGDRLLIDGGTMNNLPVSVARDLGADYLIAVDVLPPPVLPIKRPKNIFEMWWLALYTMIRARYIDAQLADVLIQPDIAHTSFFDFGQTDMLVSKGRAAAQEHVARIKADLGSW
jgi:NTE family protein